MSIRLTLRFSEAFGGAEVPHGSAWLTTSVIELPDIFAVALVLLTVALFAAMIWAGNHQH